WDLGDYRQDRRSEVSLEIDPAAQAVVEPLPQEGDSHAEGQPRQQPERAEQNHVRAHRIFGKAGRENKLRWVQLGWVQVGQRLVHVAQLLLGGGALRLEVVDRLEDGTGRGAVQGGGVQLGDPAADAG